MPVVTTYAETADHSISGSLKPPNNQNRLFVMLLSAIMHRARSGVERSRSMHCEGHLSPNVERPTVIFRYARTVLFCAIFGRIEMQRLLTSGRAVSISTPRV